MEKKCIEVKIRSFPSFSDSPRSFDLPLLFRGGFQGLWYFRWNEASLFWAGTAVVCGYGLSGSRFCHCRTLCALCGWWYEKVTITEIGDDSHCRLVLYQSNSRDWLAVAWVFLSAILFILGAGITRLLLFSRIETGNASKMKQGDCFLFHLFTVSLKCHTGQYVQSQALQLTVF